MREKSFLQGIREIPILLQWLYLSEKNTVTVENVIQVPLEFSMDDHGQILCRNLNFPELPAVPFDQELSTGSLIHIIGQLKEQPASEFPDRFENRWEEIRILTAAQMTANA